MQIYVRTWQKYIEAYRTLVAVSWLQKEDRTQTVIVTVTDLEDFQDWRKVIARKENCNLCGVISCGVIYSKLASEKRRMQYSVIISTSTL